MLQLLYRVAVIYKRQVQKFYVQERGLQNVLY